MVGCGRGACWRVLGSTGSGVARGAGSGPVRGAGSGARSAFTTQCNLDLSMPGSPAYQHFLLSIRRQAHWPLLEGRGDDWHLMALAVPAEMSRPAMITIARRAPFRAATETTGDGFCRVFSATVQFSVDNLVTTPQDWFALISHRSLPANHRAPGTPAQACLIYYYRVRAFFSLCPFASVSTFLRKVGGSTSGSSARGFSLRCR